MEWLEITEREIECSNVGIIRGSKIDRAADVLVVDSCRIARNHDVQETTVRCGGRSLRVTWIAEDDPRCHEGAMVTEHTRAVRINKCSAPKRLKLFMIRRNSGVEYGNCRKIGYVAACGLRVR